MQRHEDTKKNIKKSLCDFVSSCVFSLTLMYVKQILLFYYFIDILIVVFVHYFDHISSCSKR